MAYKDASADILPLQPNARFALDVSLAPNQSNMEVVISERRLDEGGMVKEQNMAELKLLPSTTGNLESVLPHIALGTNTTAPAASSARSTRCAAATTTKTSCMSTILKFTAHN